MKRTPLAERILPDYTRGEEITNMVTHIVGGGIGVIVLILGVVLAARRRDAWSVVSVCIYGLTMIWLYTMSSVYHGLRPGRAKKVLQVLDHCTIFLLIAGTYTPICVYLIDVNVVGLVMLIIEWASALVGIILNAFFFKNKVVQIVSLVLYLAMGWLVLFCGGFIYMPLLSFGFVLAGGIIYSIGAILYAIGHKNLNYHCVFHVFVLVSTIVQAIGVLILFF